MFQFKKWAKIKFSDFSQHPPLLIFTPGKVGSSTVYHSLKNQKSGIPLFHIHFLSQRGIRSAREFFIKNNVKIPKHLIVSELLRRKIKSNFSKVNWKIITLVREPVAHEMSAVFQLADRINTDIFSSSDSIAVQKQLDHFKNRFNSGENNSFIVNWFDREFKSAFGIDVFEYPFDQKRGYQIISHKNIDLLIIRLETLDDCFSYAIKQFLDIELTSKTNSNLSESKWYNEQYQFVKNGLMLSADVCYKYYSTRYMRHFYNKNMIESFIKKWTN
jgi:hypothetical protein